MSEPRSPLGGAGYKGYVSVNDAGCHGMITLRGDLSSPAVAEAVKAATGQAVPAQRRIEGGLDGGAAWASPDELLLMMPYAESAAALVRIEEAMGEAHHLAANVSDARAVFRLTGKGLRDTLAKLSPADLSPEALPAGEFRRSHVGQVAAAFWFAGEGEAFLVCFRSVADYMFDLLGAAAAPGSEVGFHMA